MRYRKKLRSVQRCCPLGNMRKSCSEKAPTTPKSSRSWKRDQNLEGKVAMTRKNFLLERSDLAPYLSDELFEFRDSANRFLEKHAPSAYLRECDEKKQFPRELMAEMGKQG